MKNKQTVFIYNIAAPYRVEFLNELNKYLDFHVIFENSTASHRQKDWLANDAIEFSHEFLDKKKFKVCYLLKNILLSDIYILGGYSTKLSILQIMILKLMRKNFVLNADGGFIKKDSKLTYFIKKSLISSAKWWLSSGELTNKYLIHYGAKKSNIFKYPFTSIKKSDIAYTKEVSNETKNKNIVFVGSFYKEKGYHKLIEASEILNDVNFHLVGGVLTEEEKMKTSKLSNLKTYSHLPKEKVLKVLDIADLFVFPTFQDVWGLVINEAFARGVPVLTTNMCVAGIEMIEDDTMGYIFDVNTSGKELAYIINEKLEENKFNRKRIIEQAENFTIENMAQTHLKIINQIKEKL